MKANGTIFEPNFNLSYIFISEWTLSLIMTEETSWGWAMPSEKKIYLWNLQKKLQPGFNQDKIKFEVFDFLHNPICTFQNLSKLEKNLHYARGWEGSSLIGNLPKNFIDDSPYLVLLIHCRMGDYGQVLQRWSIPFHYARDRYGDLSRGYMRKF